MNPFLKAIKTTLDKSVKGDRFSERSVFDDTERLRQWEPVKKLQERLESFLTPAECQSIHRKLVRAVYFIELVKRDVTSTKYDVRWTSRFPAGDPQLATFESCCSIHEALCVQIVNLLTDPDFQEELSLIIPWGLSPHEFPIDYINKTAAPLHTTSNICILREPEYIRLLQIRRSLLDPKINPDFQLFAAIFDKIRVKSYLTDRALTGDYKTNREKRWEAHPGSPQFAFRKDCLAVELALIEQLARFKAFPPGTTKYLQGQGLLGGGQKVARCPVTLDALDFEVLAQEVGDPTHGKSAYQVGHLNPLKAGQGNEFRHHPANISWITEDGNRIQGHLTLKETRELLLRISRNYEALIKSGEIKQL